MKWIAALHPGASEDVTTQGFPTSPSNTNTKVETDEPKKPLNERTVAIPGAAGGNAATYQSLGISRGSPEDLLGVWAAGDGGRELDGRRS